MNIRDYVKIFNQPYEVIKSNYSEDFKQLFVEESEWLGNLENKIHLLKNKKDELLIRNVIKKLKSTDEFIVEDTNSLSTFIRKINSIVLIANRINNYKEGTILENGDKLKLFELFNSLKKTSLLNELNLTLNSNLNTFLPHLFSIVKHCQKPNLFPIYYKYWKNILREVLNKEEDYDDMCGFYREFQEENRHLNFASYLGTIGIQIAKQLNDYEFDLTSTSKEYNYLVKHVINIERYRRVLDENISIGLKKSNKNMKEKFIKYLHKNNKKGSQKANAYIRALDLLDVILNSKSKSKLYGFKSIYNIESIDTVNKIYDFILNEQNNENGIFKNEEPSSYWRNKFFSAAIKSYYEFLNQINKNSVVQNKSENTNPNLFQTTFHSISFHESCKSSGLNYSPLIITRYISSLTTKPFVLLSGLSGSGKTKLAQAFAQWIAEDTTQYCIVPVGADWTNREPLLGYVNALNDNEYIKPENGALQLIIDANSNKHKPYFLILDEMNLSHVERYFADFLSVMESKDILKLHSSDEYKSNVPAAIDWPKNLFIVGTVNIDETTYMFSPKVLDRANVIEFRVNKDDIAAFLNAPQDIDFTNLNFSGGAMGEDFIKIASNKDFPTIDTTKLNEKLVLFFVELKKTGAEFGYRSASEIHRLYNQLSSLDSEMPENTKIDIAIMQKLLPKLHGSRRKLCPILETLAALCVTETTDVIKAFLNNKEAISFNDNKDVLYPLSLEKITRMYSGAIDNGFASYAEA